MKKLKYISCALTVAMAGQFVSSCESNDVNTVQPAAVAAMNDLPELKISHDTIVVTPKFFKEKANSAAAGAYMRGENKIDIIHFVPSADADSAIIKWCRQNEASVKRNLRHEREHARKVEMVIKGKRNGRAIVRSYTAVMNEVMARVGETIELVENRIYDNECPTIKNSKIGDTYEKIVQMQNSFGGTVCNINFHDQRVADMLLRGAVDDFVNATKRGFYIHSVAVASTSIATNDYIKSNECESGVWFSPENNMWAPLFTFKTRNGFPVDVWSAASRETREYVLAKTDSVVRSACPRFRVPWRSAAQRIH